MAAKKVSARKPRRCAYARIALVAPVTGGPLIERGVDDASVTDESIS